MVENCAVNDCHKREYLDLLRDCRDKLALYRRAHGGEYIGGVEYAELMRRVDGALGILAKD